ncbi:MAG: hypothetical protein EBS49_06425 [Verrucomicrobia bacterium]|nr:hypothetical protein [Verrucomicrobiota bacterium]
MVQAEIKRKSQACAYPIQPTADAIRESGKNLVSRADIPALCQFGKLGAVGVLVGPEVRIQEEGMVIVKGFHVGPHPFPRFFLGKRLS